MRPIPRRIGDPPVDGGFVPTCAVDADLDLSWKRTFGDLAVEGRTRQPGASKYGLEADDPIRVGHGAWFHCLVSVKLPWDQKLSVSARRARGLEMPP